MIYLDNSATTRVFDESARVALHYMTQEHFNPSSMYGPAVKVERGVDAVREKLGACLGAAADEIYFTAGGSESNNIAILGTAATLRGKPWRFITSSLEHPSVHEVFRALEQSGHEVVTLGCDRTGAISIQELAASITPNTALVSIMHVNNEIGTVADLQGIYNTVKRINPSTLFHSDGVQGFCKTPFGALPADLYTISGHKFHAPKGVGALLLRKGVKNAGGVMGGGQERGLRSGTTNAPGIIAMGKSLEIMQQDYAEKLERMRACKMRLWENLRRLDGVVLNGPDPRDSAPHLLNVSFLGIRGEVLLHALEAKEIYVSTGSACSSHKKGSNRILAAIGVTGERAQGAIRFSLCPYNTIEEMDIVAEEVSRQITVLRRFRRR